MSAQDRTVHATNGRVEIVRYDRQGKWFAEMRGLPRRSLTVREAASHATSPGYTWHENLPGGQRFDAEVRKRMA